MKQYQYYIIGSFAGQKKVTSGQAVKTRNFADALEEKFGKEAVCRFDTHNWKKHPLRLLSGIARGMSKSENVVFLPARNGVHVIPRLAVFFRGKKDVKLHYVVVGGWLPEFAGKSKKLRDTLKKLDGVYVETSTMQKALNGMGIDKVVIVPNFKHLTVLKKEELVSSAEKPLKLCTFSRVTEKKGIDDIVNAVKKINEEDGKCCFTLDIYGKVDQGQEEWFDALQKTFPSTIQYKGMIDPGESVEVIKSYFALTFPTRFFTEGLPGTIIDAYSAGVPVITAQWESYADVVDDGVTGFSYAFGDVGDLEKALRRAADDPQAWNAMKENCLKKAKQYDIEGAVQCFLQQ